MKIVLFKGGLGNQLFQYGLYQNFKQRGFNVRGLNLCYDHNGYELEKYFDVKVDFVHRYIANVFMLLVRLPLLLRRKIVIDRFKYSESALALFYNDFWQSKRFLPKGKWIKFKELTLNKKNTDVVRTIMSHNSVALHVRRGDYLKPGCSDMFTNLCDTAYYKKSIDKINAEVENPYFYIFSNDICWCKENLKVINATYIDWNTGDDSIYDMFLMTKCKYVIMANSTFSFWGAYLNECVLKVIYPNHWYNGFTDKTLDIFPNDWEKI